MGRFDTTKATINANIKSNSNQEITGSVLNSVLQEMVDGTDAQLTELESKLNKPGGSDPSELDKKQDKLVSGENIKTINGESVLGGGNIAVGNIAGVEIGGSLEDVEFEYATKTYVDEAIVQAITLALNTEV